MQQNNKSWEILRLMSEFINAEEISSDSPSLAIFGSARITKDNFYYQEALQIAQTFASAGWNILSGGGPGIMEAANKGAHGYGDKSIGLNIQLPHEQHPNQYQDKSLYFQYFVSRKYTFARHASAYLVMPGGIGTLDELFEILTLIQTQKIPAVPVFLFGSAFWNGLIEWIDAQLVANGFIDKTDKNIYQVTDNASDLANILLN